ncbi:hypothetical protein ACFLX7_00875 [Chloroflexota bacterium]
MYDEIKSAYEIAMEKAEKIGEATDEERLMWKHVPEGEKLAALFIKQECNLVAELGQYQEAVRKYVAEGAVEVFVRNINLPQDDLAKKNNTRAMEGLKIAKSDKVSTENIFSKVRHVLNHYLEQGEQQRKQAYESVKAEFEAKIQQAMQQQKLGSVAGTNIDVERQPQFQEEWRKMRTQLDSQYLTLLNEYKQELLTIK